MNKYNCAGIAVFRITNINNDINKEKQIIETILVKTPHGNLSMPKGKRNKGEQYIETAWRELKEETGLEPHMVNLLDNELNYYVVENNNIIYYPSIIKDDYKNFKLRNIDSEELVDVSWYDINQVMKFDKNIKNERKELIKKMYEKILSIYDTNNNNINNDNTNNDNTNNNNTNNDNTNNDDINNDNVNNDNINNNNTNNDKKMIMRYSKKMSWYLRHHLDELKSEKVKFSKENDGTVNLLDFCRVMNITEEIIMQVVNENDKKRFFVKEENGEKYIGATQGHSKKFAEILNDDTLMEKIETPLPICFHGTIYKFINSIKETGLNRMDRKHIHLIDNINAVSGTKKDSTVLVFIDMETCMKDGITFYRSKNNVILTEGINGVIPSKYIIKIKNKKEYLHEN